MIFFIYLLVINFKLMLTHRLMIVMRLYGILKRNVINRFVQAFIYYFIYILFSSCFFFGCCQIFILLRLVVDWLNSTFTAFKRIKSYVNVIFLHFIFCFSSSASVLFFTAFLYSIVQKLIYFDTINLIFVRWCVGKCVVNSRIPWMK